MIIWFSLIFPLLGAIFLSVKFRKYVTWWEYCLPFIVCVICITIAKSSAEFIQTRDTEYWNGWVVNANYYEAWDEEVPCTHAKYRSESYSCGTDNKDTCTRQVFDGYEHIYDVDYHSPYWEVENSNNESAYISQEHFGQLCTIFKNKTFVEMNRSYHSIDGNKYTTEWKGEYETLQPMTTKHSYTNRVQASNSIYRFEEVKNPRKYGVYEYPKYNGYNYPSVLPVGRYNGELDISKTGALLGAKKQIRPWVLIYENKTVDTALKQRAHWQNGNKNELVICIGVDSEQNVEWAYVFSWCENESLKVGIKDHVQSMKKLDLFSLNAYLNAHIENEYKRKEFKDFDYLSVEPPFWLVITTYIIVILVTVGVNYYVISNEYSIKW